MTKYLNISTDSTLGGNSPSDEIVSSQKAIKNYVDSQVLTGVADTDLSNLTTAGKQVCSNLPMPSTSSENITIGVSGASYTASRNGYVALYPILNSGGWVGISGNSGSGNDYGATITNANNVQGYQQVCLPVRKGCSYTINYSGVNSWAIAKLIYANGEA